METSGRIPAILAFCVALVLTTPVAAAGPNDQLRQGIRVGETIPHQLNAADQAGRERSFQSLSGKRGLILLFTRSLDW